MPKMLTILNGKENEMATINIGTTVTSQLDAGASILAAARTVDTRLIKSRLTAFEHAQRTVSAAHEKVVAAEKYLNTARTRLGELDVDQGEALDLLAGTLIVDGQPRTKPFAAFGTPSPGALMKLRAAEKVNAVRHLVGAVQRAKGVSKPTLQALQAARKAAAAIEQELTSMDKLHGAVRDARHTCDAAVQTWLTAVAALKRGARAAADEGAATLYATLFDRPGRPNSKSAKPAPVPEPAPAPDPAPAPLPAANVAP
jgi:hypothetical protein